MLSGRKRTSCRLSLEFAADSGYHAVGVGFQRGGIYKVGVVQPEVFVLGFEYVGEIAEEVFGSEAETGGSGMHGIVVHRVAVGR